MVFPPSQITSAERSILASVGRAPMRPTSRNHELFCQILQRRGDSGSPTATTTENASGAPVREPHSRAARATDPESSGGLAPEQEAVPSTRLEPAEWLSLVHGAGAEPASAPPPAAPPGSPAELASLVERWVKRVALGSDHRRSVAKLDIGGGRFAGAELLVVAEAGCVTVELSLPAAASVPGIAERLRARLERRGLSADVLVR